MSACLTLNQCSYDGKFSASKLRPWVAQQAVPLVIRPDIPSGSKVS